MISDKVLPAFYVIELEGEAVQSLIAGDYGIERIALGTKNFSSDIEASVALKNALDFLVEPIDKDLEESVDLNPEFFPTSTYKFDPLKLEEKQFAEETAEEMDDDLVQNGQVAVVMPHAFDPLGDFITTRYIVSGDGFKITGKAGVQPQEYMNARTLDKVTKLAMSPLEQATSAPTGNILH